MEKQIKSFEEAEGGVFGDLLSERKKKEFRVGILTCGYFEYWRMYPQHLRDNVAADLEKVEQNLKARFSDVVCSGLVDTLDRADEAGKLFQKENVDAVIVVYGTYMPDFIALHATNYVKHAPTLFFSVQNTDRVDKDGDYEHSLRNSGTIGIAQITGTLRKMGRNYSVVVGSTEDERAYRKIEDFVKANRAVKELRESNIGVIGNVFRGMYDLELSKTFLKSAFDVNVIYLQPSHLLEEWEQVTDEETKALSETLTKRFKQRGITAQDVHCAVRLAIAMRKLAEKFRLDAMCFLDQHFVQKQTKTTARIGASLLMEYSDITVTCEGDLGGLVTMMLMRSISGLPALMGEWGEYDTELNACLIMGHGIGTPALAASDDAVTLTRTPEEWGFEGAGVNYELILKPGAATIAHIIETQNGYKMILSPGESLAFPTLKYDELHAMIGVKQPIKEYLEKVFESGVTHHAIVGLTDMCGALTLVSDILGLELFRIE